MIMAVAAFRTVRVAVVQCNLKHIKHKHVYFFWTVRDAEAVQYFNSTFAVCADLCMVLCLHSHTGLIMQCSIDFVCMTFSCAGKLLGCRYQERKDYAVKGVGGVAATRL